MARYQYAGPGPVPGDDEIIRPGDVREFGQEPDWGPWELLDGPDAAAPAQVAPPIPSTYEGPAISLNNSGGM